MLMIPIPGQVYPNRYAPCCTATILSYDSSSDIVRYRKQCTAYGTSDVRESTAVFFNTSYQLTPLPSSVAALPTDVPDW